MQSVFFTTGLAELLVRELRIQRDMGSEGRRGENGIAKSVSFLFFSVLCEVTRSGGSEELLVAVEERKHARLELAWRTEVGVNGRI